MLENELFHEIKCDRITNFKQFRDLVLVTSESKIKRGDLPITLTEGAQCSDTICVTPLAIEWWLKTHASTPFECAPRFT